MFRTHGERIVSTGSNGISTQHKTTPEAWKEPGNTVLESQVAGLTHPKGPLYLVCIHTSIYIFSFLVFLNINLLISVEK